jgi:hypothetical protein
MFSWCRIAAYEVRQQFAGGVVDHRDQIQLLVAAAFQPVVFAGVPLHEFSAAAAAWPPHVDILDLLLLGPPEPCLRHDLPQRLASDPQRVIFG